MDEDVLAIIGLFIVSPICLFGYLSFRAWLERRAKIGPTAMTPALEARFDALEATVEALAVEVERLAEGQRFVSKVLVERPLHTALPGTADAAAPLER